MPFATLASIFTVLVPSFEINHLGKNHFQPFQSEDFVLCWDIACFPTKPPIEIMLVAEFRIKIVT